MGHGTVGAPRLAGWPLIGPLLVLLALLAACAAPAGRLVVDDAEALERDAIAAAAAPLLGRGASVGVFVAAQGDATGADFDRRLAAAGLREGEAIAPAALAVYISLAPRYSELRAGARWSADLPDATLRAIRLETLNPALREGAMGAGLAATLAALDERLASPSPWRRLQQAAAYTLVAAALLAALWLSPAGQPLARLWRRSPPGRLAQWLWDQTPAGRGRLQRALRTVELRLENRVEYARSWCKAAAGANPREVGAAVRERTAALDRRLAEARRTLKGWALYEAYDRLAWDYQALGSDAEQLAPRPRSARGSAQAASFVAGASDLPSYSSSASASDSPTSWDTSSGADSGSPSSDGGSW